MADNEEDIVIRISPEDKGAKQLLKEVTKALQEMGLAEDQVAAKAKGIVKVLQEQAQAEKARQKVMKETEKQTQAQERAAKALAAQEARSVKDAERAARAAQTAQARVAREATKQAAERRRAESAAAKEAAAAARVETQARNAAVRAETQLLRDKANLRKAEANAANAASRAATAAASKQAQADASSVRAQAQLLKDRAKVRAAEEKAAAATAKAQDAATKSAEKGAARAAAASAKAAAQTERAANRAAAQQQKAANAAIKASNQVAAAQTKAAAQAARAAQQQANAQTKAANQAAKAAAAQARAAAKANSQTQRSSLLLREAGLAARSLVRQFIVLASVAGGLKLIKDFVSAGLAFNETLESANLGIASLITAQSKLTDAQGKTLKGAEALDAAYGLAEDQVQKLRIAGIQTAATTEQLVDAFQQAVGAGIRTGLSLDQIRVFTVRATQAAFALGVPMNQLNQEVRSILDGTIDRNSRVAKALQLTNKEVKAAKEQGRLQDLLNEKFAAFEVAGERSQETFRILKSNIIEAVQVFAGDATKPLFDSLKAAGARALNQVFNFDTAQINDQFKGLLKGFQSVARVAGSAISDGIDNAVKAAIELSHWIEENEALVNSLAGAAGTAAREFGNLVAVVLTLPIALAKAEGEVGLLSIGAHLLASLFKVIADNIGLIVGALSFFALRGGIAAILAGGPVTATIAGLLTILTVIDAIANASHRAQLETNRRTSSLGDEAAEAIALQEEYVKLSKQINSNALKGKELTAARNRLSEVTEALVKLDPKYGGILKDQQKTLEETAKAMQELTNARLTDLATQLIAAQGDLIMMEQKKKLLADAAANARKIGGRAQVTNAQQLEHEMDQLNDKIEEQTALVNGLRAANKAAFDAAKKVENANSGVTLTANKPDEDLSGAAAKKLRDKQEKDAIQAATGALNATKKRVAAEKEVLENSYKQNLISAEKYFHELARLDGEITDMEQNLRGVRGAFGDEGEQERARAEFEGLEDDRVKANSDADQKILDERRRFEQIKRDLMVEGLTAENKMVEVAAIELADKYREALETAIREQDWTTVDVILKRIGEGVARAQADAIDAQLSLVSAKLNNSLQQTQNELDVGSITHREANERIRDSNLEAAESTRLLIEQLTALLPLLNNDPILAQKIADLNVQMQGFAIAARFATDEMLKLGLAAQGSIIDNLGNALADIITGTQNVGEAFRQMAQAIIADIARIITHLLAQLAVEEAIALVRQAIGFAAGGSVGTKGNLTQSGGKAQGGPITGPGTKTSDSILTRLSRGEYVVRAAAVDHYGTDMLSKINSKQYVPPRHRYASGGLVDGARTPLGSQLAASKATTQSLAGILKVGIGLDPGLVLNTLGTDAAGKVLLGHVEANKRKYQRALEIKR